MTTTPETPTTKKAGLDPARLKDTQDAGAGDLSSPDHHANKAAVVTHARARV